MIYQKLLTSEKPYFTALSHNLCYGNHRHPEAEFVFCIEGCVSATVDGAAFTVNEGEILCIAPMSAHEFNDLNGIPNRALVIEVGHTMLGERFAEFTKSVFTPAVKSYYSIPDLRSAVLEAAESHGTKSVYNELMITSLVYKLCAILIREFAQGDSTPSDDLRAVANIDRALDLIRTSYADPITVEHAAAVTGYGKSNFCKLFKQIVGETFHDALNRRRVENAKYYLRETALAVSEIAPLVGFADAKSFCRVFGNAVGTSPGRYRKESK